MAIIYLRHSEHGDKIATMEMEAEQDEKNGWVRYDPDEADDSAVNELAAPARRRRKDTAHVNVSQ
jgi:hypothetical protein